MLRKGKKVDAGTAWSEEALHVMIVLLFLRHFLDQGRQGERRVRHCERTTNEDHDDFCFRDTVFVLLNFLVLLFFFFELDLLCKLAELLFHCTYAESS